MDHTIDSRLGIIRRSTCELLRDQLVHQGPPAHRALLEFGGPFSSPVPSGGTITVHGGIWRQSLAQWSPMKMSVEREKACGGKSAKLGGPKTNIPCKSTCLTWRLIVEQATTSMSACNAGQMDRKAMLKTKPIINQQSRRTSSNPGSCRKATLV